MYDAIIVGAGFSGSILARKLAEEKNMKVLHHTYRLPSFY